VIEDQNKVEGTQATYFTSCGALAAQTAAKTTKALMNQACLHQLSPSTAMPRTDLDVAESFSAGTTSRYDSSQFYGIIIDTGAAKRSTAGVSQFEAFQRLLPTPLNTSTKGTVTVQFGIGITSSLGSALIRTPVGNVEFHVMPADTPFLTSLRDIDMLRIYFNNLTNTLVTLKGNVLVVRRFGHSFLL
jgi:hypothetical protein